MVSKKEKSGIFHQVNQVMKKSAGHYRDDLEKLGFEWVDDEESFENQEGLHVGPRNSSQEILEKYFQGGSDPEKEILNHYLNETRKEDINFPFFRFFFKLGNEALKHLLLYGLKIHPNDRGLLNDLSYFHEYQPILSVLIRVYREACMQENNLQRLQGLIEDFYIHTKPDGFDVFKDLQERFLENSEKYYLLKKIIAEYKKNESLIIEF